MNRKEFLEKTALQTLALLGASPLLQVAFGAESSDDEILVVVFLRGACDGLSLIPPIDGEDREIYESARPSLSVPLKGSKAALRLDDRFGMHPAGAPLYELFKQKQLAIIHSAGLTSDSRSHFDAQTFMELGTPNRKSIGSGWMTRYLDELDKKGQKSRIEKPSFMRAIAIGTLVPTSLMAYPSVAVVNNLGGFNLTGDKNIQLEQRNVLRRMYKNYQSSWLSRYGMETLEAVDALETVKPGDYRAAPGGADYPKGDIGNKMKTLAQLIRMDLGLRVATVDMGGWDTHKNQEGTIHGLFGQLSQALSTFQQDLAQGRTRDYSKRMTVVVMSEFGRRLKENASRGTDHGHGNVMFLLGSGIAGGKVYGSWPGLKTEQLYDRADLAVTTDYRQILAEVLDRGFGRARMGAVFPSLPAYRPLGLLKSEA